MDCTVVSLSWKFPYGSGDLSEEPRAESVKSEFKFWLKRERRMDDKVSVAVSGGWVLNSNLFILPILPLVSFDFFQFDSSSEGGGDGGDY